MMSQTHLLIGAATLTKPGATMRNVAVLIGALLPDLSIYAIYATARLQGVESRRIWDTIYWQEPSQTLSAISNSFPLFAALLIPALYLAHRAKTQKLRVIGYGLAALALSALLHLLFDISLHAEDAHRHFWPLSNWRFASPISYWDPNYYGHIVQLIEFVLGLLLSLVLWWRFKTLWVRAVLAVAMVGYIAVPVYFALTLG